jgi:hypothetical protein
MKRSAKKYDRVKQEVFSLPLAERIRLFREIQHNDVRMLAWEAHRSLSDSLSKTPLSEEEVEALVHEVRSEK